jgi:glutathione S-transferase
MSLVLFHHPHSRAATVVWMLEELGLPYELVHVDLKTGEQHGESHKGRNPMGKVPVLVDGDTTVTESAAIAVYLADRYALGRLAPALDDPARGTFLRWCFYAPSVVEPGCLARASKWEFKPGSAGWGRYEDMLATLESAVRPGPWLLGEQFTMADIVLGGTLRWMLGFNMLDKTPPLVAYTERLAGRAALLRADARNAAELATHT